MISLYAQFDSAGGLTKNFLPKVEIELTEIVREEATLRMATCAEAHAMRSALSGIVPVEEIALLFWAAALKALVKVTGLDTDLISSLLEEEVELAATLIAEVTIPKNETWVQLDFQSGEDYEGAPIYTSVNIVATSMMSVQLIFALFSAPYAKVEEDPYPARMQLLKPPAGPVEGSLVLEITAVGCEGVLANAVFAEDIIEALQE